MSNKSNIDKLFREGLTNPTPHAFNEAAWNNMNSMLNSREKYSWISLGKLASAALFLSTVLIGSNIPKSQLVAGSENPIENIEMNPSQSIAQNSIQLASNLTRNLESQNKNSSTTNTKDVIGQGQQFDNEALIALAEESLSSVVADFGVVSTNVSSSLETITSDFKVASEDSPNDLAFKDDISNIDKITPRALRDIDVDFPEYGFDPVDESTMPKVNIQSLSVFGGISLENGLGSAGQFSANNFLYTAGFYYTIEATQNISVSTGLGYRSKSGKGIELTRTQTEYGFGKSQTTETLALNRLHYIDLPIEVQYNIKGKHTVFGGASISYLAGVKSALAKTHDESLQSSTNSVENTWNYQDGLNKWDAGLRLGYDYSLGQNLSIGGMVQYGLTDITSNETFEVQDNSNNMEVRVTLKYTPFRF